MNLATINTLNECAEFIYEIGITTTPVQFEAASSFIITNKKLRNLCKDRKLNAHWERLVLVNNKFASRICRSVCSPTFVLKLMQDEMGVAYKTTYSQINTVSPEVRNVLNQLRDILVEIKTMEQSPILDAITEKINDSIHRNQKNIILILRDDLLLPETNRLLSRFIGQTNINVKKPKEVRGHPKTDRMIHLGPISILQRFNEEYLLRAPVTDEIDILALSYEHEATSQSLNIFDLDADKRFPVNRTNVHAPNRETSTRYTTAEITDEEFEMPPEVAQFDNSYSASSRSVKSLRCILGGNYGTHLDLDGNAYIAHCRQNGTVLLCTEVEKKPACNLEPGELVVLTTEGSGDLIEPYADKILGSAAQNYRELQTSWKGSLSQLVNTIGMDEVIARLASLGMADTPALNVKNWCDPTNIAPGEENSFRCILTLINRAEKIDLHIAAVSAIRGANISAGAHLQGQLRNALKGMDLGSILANGFLVIRPDADGPAKTVFLLEQISNTIHEVNSHLINRVFKLRREEVAV